MKLLQPFDTRKIAYSNEIFDIQFAKFFDPNTQYFQPQQHEINILETFIDSNMKVA